MERVFYMKSLRDVRTKYNVSALMGSWIKKKNRANKLQLTFWGTTEV